MTSCNFNLTFFKTKIVTYKLDSLEEERCFEEGKKTMFGKGEGFVVVRFNLLTDFSTGTRHHRMFDWNRIQTWTRRWWREEEDAGPAAVVVAVVVRGRASAFANRVEEGEGWSYPRIRSSSSTWKCTSSRPGNAWRKWLAKRARCGAPCRRVRKGNTFSWRKRRDEEEDRDKPEVCLLVIKKSSW